MDLPHVDVPDKVTRQEWFGLLGLTFAASIAIGVGWNQFWFLTDDAHISFRYISNSMLGHGYVWNAPPFQPVEGYTSFLWIFLLDLIWRVWGIEPPVSANYVSLGFAWLTLAVGALIVFKMQLSEQLRRHRLLLLTLIFIGVLSNRTFLAWTSSGLETAMFNFFLISWLACVLCLRAYSQPWLFGITSTTALIYLSRPDGLLTSMATICLIGFAFYAKNRRRIFSFRDLVAIMPLLILPVHLWWRLAVYGKFLPNTYYAKKPLGDFWIQVGSGYRYLLSFIIEYSLWFWMTLFLCLLGYLLVLRLKRCGFKVGQMFLFNIGLEQLILEPEHSIENFSGHSSDKHMPITLFVGLLAIVGFIFLGMGIVQWGALFVGSAFVAFMLLGVMGLSLVQLVGTVTLLVHIYYYTVFIGGDHFEFRVYSHLILLIFTSFLWILSKLQIRFRLSLALFALFILLSWPIPWIHWNQSQATTTRVETLRMKVSVADSVEVNSPLPLPSILIGYLRYYDSLQFWLIDHFVGMRHQEHKIFYEYVTKGTPSREEGLLFSAAGYPILPFGSVGVLAWVLPHFNIIDTLGLNDSIVARNPDKNGALLRMAHDRVTPAGYVDCFQPNVFWENNELTFMPRQRPFTASNIIECEERYRAHGGYPVGKPNQSYSVEYLIDNEFLLDEIHIAEIESDAPIPIYIRLFWTPKSITNSGYDLKFDLININDGQSISLARSFGIYTEDFAHVERQISGTLTSHILRTPKRLPAGAYLLQIKAFRRDGIRPTITNSKQEDVSNIVVGPLVLGELTDEKVNPTYPTIADFANGIRLEGYDIDQEDDRMSILLHWQATETVTQRYTVFVHLINEQNELIAQNDAEPYLSTDLWASGVQLYDRHAVIIPPEILQASPSSALYQIRIGLYDSHSQKRVALSSAGCLDTSENASLVGFVNFDTIQTPMEVSCSDVPLIELGQ